MRNIYFTMLLLVTVILSCTENNELREVDNAINNPNSKLAENEISEILRECYNNHNNPSTKSNTGNEYYIDKNYEIQCYDSTLKKAENISVSQYIIKDKEKQGYAVIINDKRFPLVLAYVPEGSFNDTTVIAPLNSYFKSIPHTVSVLYNKYGQVDPQGITPRMFVANMGTYISTEWHGEAPYNKQIPISCSLLKAPAGSHTVAMAQVLAHFKRGAYNWSDLLTSSTIGNGEYSRAEEVAKLFANVGAAANTTYSCNGSNASISDVVKGFKTLKFPAAYSKAITNASMAKELIEAEITAKKLIVMQGTQYENGKKNSTHFWVVDGYSIYYDSNWVRQNDFFQLHCNWGWGNASSSSPGYGNKVLSNGSFSFLTNGNLIMGGMLGSDKDSFRSMTIIAGLY